MTMESRFRWFALVAVVLIAVAVGMISYNAGVSHGLAMAPAAANAAAPGAAPVYPPYMPYMWYRPWGFGFGPIFLLLVLFFVIRPLLWGGFHRRRYYWDAHDVPPRFEEWHRRAHEKMGATEA
jgi:hypothetical protein